MNYLPPIPCEGEGVGVIFTDLHFPAQDEGAVSELKQLIKEVRPDHLWDLGDVTDDKEIARFNKDAQVKEFLANGGQTMPEIWEKVIDEHDNICDMAPKARKLILFGNHDIRIREEMNKLQHLVGVGFNPYLNAWRKSRHRMEIYHDYPNNDAFLSDVGIKTQIPIILSHGGAGTSGNHAKKTWNSDYSLGCSRIYGHSHDPNFWQGIFEVRPQVRDERFSWALGAMCDRSNEKYFGYCNKRARTQWKPTALIYRAKKGFLTFEEVRFTPATIQYERPIISQELEV